MNHKIIFSLTIVLSILGGLGIGYLVFSAKKTAEPTATTSAITAVEYTCTMDPQIRQPEPGSCPICGMDLVPVAETGKKGNTILELSAEAIKIADIQTQVVGQGAVLGKKVLLSGKIQVDERTAASQVAHVPGRIEQLFVTYTGETVRKGQPLARLYAPQLFTAQQELLEAIRFKGKNSDLAEAARNRIRFWKISDAFIQQVEDSGKPQREIVIRADRDGVVMNREVAVGDYLEAGSPLLELMDLRRLWAVFEAYETDLPDIRLGAVVQFTTPALPNQTFSARISFIDPLIDPMSRTASLRGELVNNRGALKPEMFIRGELTSKAGPTTNQLVVPKTAVLWTGKRSVVYVKVPDVSLPSFEFREVELGDATANGYLIEKGLQPGEEVVVNGAFVIDATAQINNQFSMMNRMVNSGTAEEIPESKVAQVANPNFNKQFKPLLDTYLVLKDALVASDAGKVSQQAQVFLKLINKVPISDLSMEAKMQWQQQQKNLTTHVSKIQGATDLEIQRKQFDFLSQVMIELVKKLGIHGAALYVHHCPMAFDNKGADWLSEEKKVLNPYFGKKMVTCGYVKDSLL
jgi:membrane fusion protein, copper/silver efflux system